jgi:hypothetical protein
VARLVVTLLGQARWWHVQGLGEPQRAVRPRRDAQRGGRDRRCAHARPAQKPLVKGWTAIKAFGRLLRESGPQSRQAAR